MLVIQAERPAQGTANHREERSMIVALTVRKLKPGSLEDFKKAFVPAEGTEAPAGWKRFYALRNVDDENEVITFGMFDGSVDDLRSSQDSGDYDERRAKADELVESVGADGLYEVLEERKMD
jgi:heme-degrading monooxygenase HmoA